MKQKAITLIAVFLLTLLGSACQTQKPTYPPKRKKNRKCKECPKFSFVPSEYLQVADFRAISS